MVSKLGRTRTVVFDTSRLTYFVATKTRVVLAGSRVHILGAFENIGMARESIVSLVLGAQPGKVYNNLRIMAGRMKERF
jgi:RNA-binding protein PNO1